MKLFTCADCGQLLFFENAQCQRCGRALGFVAERTSLATLDADGDLLRPLDMPDEAYRWCANAAHGACNWLVPADSDIEYCRACDHNRTVPDLGIERNLELWRDVEAAKHRMIYSLLRFGLPLASKREEPETGLAFDFLSDEACSFKDDERVMTGHAEGLITLNLSEADPAAREQARTSMDEPYRTLLGHFRHEVGHYYWERLIRDDGRLDAFRALFGDERDDYGKALERHHTNGPPADWPTRFVSAYASAHPWEDWAETWAHYFHMVDTLETAHAHGITSRPRASADPDLTVEIDFVPYHTRKFDRLMDEWPPLTVAINSLNRSMGQPDLYPFVLAEPAETKMRFVHDLIVEVTRSF